MATNKDVKAMYSNIAPFPGTLIRFLNDSFLPRKLFYKMLLAWRWKNSKRQFDTFSTLLMGFAPSQDNPLRILDLGCGTGERTLALKVAFPKAEVVGVDISKTSISYAIAAAKELGVDGIKFHELDIQHDFEVLHALGKFDLVHSIGVIHHTESPRDVVANVSQIIAPGGIFYLMVYADYGERHKERLVREAIHRIIPNDRALNERYDLVTKLGIFRLWGRVYGVRHSLYDALEKLRLGFSVVVNSIRTLGLSWYTRPNGLSPNFDAFVNPIATNFTADSLSQLVNCERMELKAYRFEHDNESIREKLTAVIPTGFSLLDRMAIEERFVMPWGYYLILQKT